MTYLNSRQDPNEAFLNHNRYQYLATIVLILFYEYLLTNCQNKINKLINA